MNRCLLFLLLASLSAASVACVQKLDTGLAGGNSGLSAWPSDPVSLGVVQCEAGSAECFALCGSPLCALQDGAIPPALSSPPIYTPEGTVGDPCDQVRQEAIAIRQRSCTPCHLPEFAGLAAGFGYVMDDGKLVVGTSHTYSNDAGPLRYVVPGDPEGSFAYQRTMSGLAGKANGMPPPPDQCIQLLGKEAGAGIVRPTSEDVSVLYEWMTNCVLGTDGGAYSTSYYGGFYGPGSEAGRPVDDSDAGATKPAVDGGAAPRLDAGAPTDAGRG